jgi:hypothetical protein
MSRSTKKKRQGDLQLTLFGAYDHPLLDKIRALKVDELTPLAALQVISQWQQELERDP